MHAAASRPPRSAWRWPLLLKASVGCHAMAATWALTQPGAWPWALGLVGLDHALLTATGLWPRSTWLGDNLLRLPPAAIQRREVALTIDDGPDPAVTPEMLDLLDRHGARATFFCIAQQAQRHPALCRQIVQRGHSVQNHSLRHAHHFSLLGPAGLRRELSEAQDVFAQITGKQPQYFRAPAGLRNVFLAPVLHELDLRLVAWTRRGFDTRTGDAQVVTARLARHLAAGDILLLHDRHAAASSSGRPVSLDVLPDLLQRFATAGLRAVTLPEALERS